MKHRGRVTAVSAAIVAFAAASPAVGQSVRAGGIDSLRVRANIQTQYNTTSVEDRASSEWLMRRARIGLRGWIDGWIRADLEADFGTGKAKLTDAYIRLDFDRAFRIRMGQFKKGLDALELMSNRQLGVIERSGAPRGAGAPTPNGLVGDLGYTARDLGIEWRGEADRAWATVGVFNGAGGNTAEGDDGKQVVGRVSVGVAAGWTITGAWTALKVNEPPDEDDDAWYQAGEIAITGGRYAAPGARVLAQAMFGDNYDPAFGGGADVSFLALQAVLTWHMATPGIERLLGWEPSVRVGWTDPDTDTDDDAATITSVALNLYLHRHVKAQVGLDVLTPSAGDSETAFRLHTVFEF